MKQLTLSVFLPVLLAASPLIAQDDVRFSIRQTKACLQDAAGSMAQRQCIGASANACMDANDLGSSTYGMGACLNFEAEWWDGRLNAAYRSLMKSEKQDDAELAADGINAPKKAPALREMQRAWIAYRDATCKYEYSQWGGGTGGGPASVSCVMRLTAEQALYLEGSAQGF